MSSVVRLVVLLARRSPLRPLSLVILTAIATVVFVLVSDLSRVSQEGLDQAIVAENGVYGSFVVTLDSGLGLTAGAESALVGQAARAVGVEQRGYFEDMPSTRSECPPFQAVGDQVLRLLWDAPGKPTALPFGSVDGVDTQWCIGGQTIPDSALFYPSDSQRGLYQDRLYLAVAYREVILLATQGPVRRGYFVVSRSDATNPDDIARAVQARVAPFAELMGLDPAGAVQVARSSRDAQLVRAASSGIAIVYNVIRWGVLLLAGIALLSFQLVATRQRAWFYGLARALGTGGPRIVLALVVEVVGIVTIGATVAFILLVLASAQIESFASQAFQVKARPLAAANLGTTAVGLAVIAVAAGLLPTIGVLRRDPLEVLEAPRD